jgi:RNA polymerase-binding transcription factor DksA
VTDLADHAQEREIALREDGLFGVRLAAAALHARPVTSRRVCGCGDRIEDERLAVVPGAKRCLACQLAAERMQRLYRSS